MVQFILDWWDGACRVFVKSSLLWVSKVMERLQWQVEDRRMYKKVIRRSALRALSCSFPFHSFPLCFSSICHLHYLCLSLLRLAAQYVIIEMTAISWGSYSPVQRVQLKCKRRPRCPYQFVMQSLRVLEKHLHLVLSHFFLPGNRSPPRAACPPSAYGSPGGSVLPPLC